jgi:hypothetical protein
MSDVTLCSQLPEASLRNLLKAYGLTLCRVDDSRPIPGSHFGEPEAGLIGNRLYIRKDTPIHSLLHESCHYICMDEQRRLGLHTDAGGDYDEENAVCYLSILLAGLLPDYSSRIMMKDMDQWGYTFRLGSAQDWFEQDAEDAREWLLSSGIIDEQYRVTGKMRDSAEKDHGKISTT